MKLAIGSFVAAALGAALAAAAPAADTHNIRAVAGQSYEGTIVGAGDTHAYLLEDFAPQLFSVTVKAARGSALVPDLFLEDPTAQDATASMAAFRRDTTRAVIVRNADSLSSAGPWILRVGGKTNTTGGYKLKITTKVLRAFRGTGAVPGTATFGFFAPTGSKVSLKAVPVAGSIVQPVFGAVTAPACVSADAVPGLRAGTATIVVPFSGDYMVDVVGNGGTEGGFAWIARIKPFKPSRIAVRVNGGATYFPAEGPAPARLVTRPGQDVRGFDTDGIDLVWREVRLTGNPQQLGKNEIGASRVSGANVRKISGTFADDEMVTAGGFGLGPTLVAAIAENNIFVFPREGGQESVLAPAPPAVRRMLVTRDLVVVLQQGGIDAYDLMGAPTPVSGDGSEYLDMALGGLGVIFAVETAGGDLELRSAPLAGGGDTLLADFGPNPGLQGLAARGAHGFVALGDGAGGSVVHRATTCDPGNPVLVRPFPMAPIDAIAADELNIYAIENDPIDGPRIRQIPAGGGEPTVLARDNDVTAYDILPSGLAAAGGFVYFMGDDGTEAFFRVKRR